MERPRTLNKHGEVIKNGGKRKKNNTDKIHGSIISYTLGLK